MTRTVLSRRSADRKALGALLREVERLGRRAHDLQNAAEAEQSLGRDALMAGHHSLSSFPPLQSRMGAITENHWRAVLRRDHSLRSTLEHLDRMAGFADAALEQRTRVIDKPGVVRAPAGDVPGLMMADMTIWGQCSAIRVMAETASKAMRAHVGQRPEPWGNSGPPS